MTKQTSHEQTGAEQPCCELVPGGPVEGAIRPPGSKSLTNRALICAALAHGRSTLTGALQSEDTEVMIDALMQLGISIQTEDSGQTLIVEGCGGHWSRDASSSLEEIYVANSGTTIRFLSSALAALGGNYRLSGVERMHQRPIGDLVRALVDLGCDVRALSPGECPPLEIHSRGWTESEVTVAGAVSSQYLSGILMAAPACKKSITVRVQGELVSRPYVEMTLALMRSFGVETEIVDSQTFCVQGQHGYLGTMYAIEPDASAASYPWAVAAISGGKVLVQGLGFQALQGDVQFVRVLQQMGCDIEESQEGITVTGKSLRGIDIDMNSISDCVQTLAVVALFADSPTVIRGVEHNRFKETDRIADLASELRKLGAQIIEHRDGMEIIPGDYHGAVLETYNDHRMAMSLALAGLRIPGVKILNPACTVKTYPHYFADLEKLLGRSHRWSSACEVAR